MASILSNKRVLGARAKPTQGVVMHIRGLVTFLEGHTDYGSDGHQWERIASDWNRTHHPARTADELRDAYKAHLWRLALTWWRLDVGDYRNGGGLADECGQ